MKYPYIGKYQSAVKIFFDHGLSAVIESGHGVKRHESNFKNITTKYLANTYGEVKSKEHAEFIKMLAETNKIPCAVVSIDMNYTMFYVIDGCLFFCLKEIDIVGDYKQITIPLPPDCESVDEWPKVGSSVEWGHTGKGEVKSLSDGFAWVKLDNKDYTTVYVSSLRKPKTPEQELREFLHLLWRENNEDFDDFADIAILHLKKKGEGDE